MIHISRLLTCLLVCATLLNGVASAQGEVNASSTEDSLHIAGYTFLAFAIFGWGFFLCLLGTAVYLVIKQFRHPKQPKNPVRCK